MEQISNFENVKSKDSTLPERVADQISQLIIDRQLTTDDKLPNEFELATQLNVGRGTVREAVKLLVARNVLVIRRGKGTYIAHNPGVVEDPLGFTYYSDQLQLGIDLLEVRTNLEPWVARLAAERATQEDINTMLHNCRLVEEDILAGRDHLPNDMNFHVSIANCMHNLVTPKLIPVITYSVRLFGSLNGNSLLSETIIGHHAIAEAIRTHDPDQAEKAMLDHLKQNQSELQAIVKELKESKTDIL
ncbi:MAG: FadR/GntR family transcriptional regulator [Lachnospiraceae bacterium]|nr:FadR/GntR family transcriptional regulator [Lachnospiraceae bacterium]